MKTGFSGLERLTLSIHEITISIVNNPSIEKIYTDNVGLCAMVHYILQPLRTIPSGLFFF